LEDRGLSHWAQQLEKLDRKRSNHEPEESPCDVRTAETVSA
jgi:hypothetical protein